LDEGNGFYRKYSGKVETFRALIDENEAKYIMEQLFYENSKNLFLNRK
jgi:hypothetical protein